MTPGRRGPAIRIFISLAAIGLILYFLRSKLGEAFLILRHGVTWPWFLAAVGLYGVCLLVLGTRLFYVFRVQQLGLSLGQSLYLSFLGIFFNLFFPSAVGGDVAKAYYAYKYSGKKIASTTAVLLDRLLGFVALMVMALVALFFFSKELNDSNVNRIIYAFLGLMLFTLFFFSSRRFARSFQFLLVLIPEKWRARLADVYQAIYYYKNHTGTLVWTLFLSVIVQSLVVVVHYWVVLSLGVNLPIALFFIFVPLVTIVSMAPSVSGLGVREAGVIYFFSRFMPPERALALSLLLDILVYSYSFASGVVYAIRGGLKGKEAIHEMEELQ